MFGWRNKPVISNEAKKIARKNLVNIISDEYYDRENVSLNTLAQAYLRFLKSEKWVDLDRSVVNLSNLIQQSLDDCIIWPDANRNYFIDVQKVMNNY